MPRLTYTVDVTSSDHKSDLDYLKRVQSTFEMITKDLSPFGWAGEKFSKTEIEGSSTKGQIEEGVTS